AVLAKAADLARELTGDGRAFIRELRLRTPETLADAEEAAHRLRFALEHPPEARRRRRKSPLTRQERPLTPLETHTLEVVGKHGQNFSAAAAELRKDPKTVRENYERAMNKLNRMAGPRTRSAPAGSMPTDKRGQPNPRLPGG